jgi:hypothetical protein
MPKSSDSSLLAQKNWRYFLRKLVGLPELFWMRSLPTRGLEACLTVPVAAARWIEEFHPEFKEKAELHLVIAGVERGPDVFNEGRWYQVIPQLLERPGMRLAVSLVGPSALTTTRLTPGGGPPGDIPDGMAGVPSALAPARTYPQTLGEFLKDHGSDVDLILLSHPGFERHASEWLAPDQVPVALEAKKPVGCLAYSANEYEHERWILAQFGFSGTGRGVHNPLALEDPEALMPSAFGSAIWELSDTLPAPGFEVNLEALEVDHERCAAYGGAVFAGFGAQVDNAGMLLPAEDGGPGFVYLPGGLLVDLADGSILTIEGKTAIHLDAQLPPEVLADYPAEGSLPYERKAWALDVRSFLDESDDEEVDEELIAAFEDLLTGRGGR